MANRRFIVPLVAVLFLCMPLTLRADEANTADAERLFSIEVLPVLKSKCFACHGQDPDKIKGKLDLRSLQGLLAGGAIEGPAVVPGKPEKSPLFLAITWTDGLEMPPKENDRLTGDQIDVIRRWIAAGAPWPDEKTQKRHIEAERSKAETADGVIVPTSGGLDEAWTFRRYKPEDLWAFRPVVKPKVPGASPVDHPEHAANPIDAFVDARREAAGFGPAPQAGPRTLIRRATYDLTGLPPTTQEIKRFLAAWEEDQEQAWSGLIDRLLDSPHYGERWAQHWLDIVRYADTGGYSNDYERSNMWRYRDYVIRSFQNDKPYNQFVIEQIAGDELADRSVLERSSGDSAQVSRARLDGSYTEQESEWLIATGFLRIGPWDNAMVKTPEARQIYLDDVVDSFGQAFLSTTMSCVKCHDHKFDPIPTRDYYRLYAAFASTQMAERPVPFLATESRDGFDEGRALVERMRRYAVDEKNKILEKQEAAARAWYASHGLDYVPEAKRSRLPDEQKPPRHVGLDHIEQGQLKVRKQDEWIWNRRLERYQAMAQGVYSGSDVNYPGNAARRLRIAKKDPGATVQSFILSGGSLQARGDAVQPGILSAIGVPVDGAPPDNPYVLPDANAGRRFALAKWVTDPSNPLTTRSIVNRVWQHHFGQAIARNPNNFGAKGAKPTHPELLDWLASDFVEHGWTLKRMHRVIMTSSVYKQAGTHPAINEIRAADPNNELFAYYPPRRLTAEELRDSLLVVTGELNRDAAGGLPAMPEINMEVALQPRMIQFSLAPAYQPSPKPDHRNRRTIYAYRVRGMADPFLELFNQPSPNSSCEIRDSASVTPQVFTLLNSDVMVDRSIAFALRLESEADSLPEQIGLAFRLALGRSPDKDERDRLSAYVREMREYHSDVNPEPAVYPRRITRSLVEEFSGKPFEYEEILPVFEEYVPDTKPWDVGPKTRALADLCLLLFNSNEFIYIY
ncbi:MAG: PSD1 and planctomycete cytochrome C domain-containing protein [Planctomycetota bacterium]